MAISSFVSDQQAAGDFEKITVSTVAIGFTAAKLHNSDSTASAVRAFFTVEDAAIRIRFDGTDPVAATGHPLNPGDFFTLDGYANIRRLRMIRSGGSDGTVNVTFFYKNPLNP